MGKRGPRSWGLGALSPHTLLSVIDQIGGNTYPPRETTERLFFLTAHQGAGHCMKGEVLPAGGGALCEHFGSSADGSPRLRSLVKNAAGSRRRGDLDAILSDATPDQGSLSRSTAPGPSLSIHGDPLFGAGELGAFEDGKSPIEYLCIHKRLVVIPPAHARGSEDPARCAGLRSERSANTQAALGQPVSSGVSGMGKAWEPF